MSGKPKILMVDDEPNVLSGYRRTLGKSYKVMTAEGGAAGLQMLDTAGPFPVVITDMRMPEIDGLQFLKAAQAKHRDTVYMMLTGNADQQTAIDAINDGQIFRFLNKPCPAETLDEAIRAALRQYELVRAEQILLRDTLAGCIRLLVEAVTLSDPALGYLAKSVRTDVPLVCAELGLANDWRLSMAASLCFMGASVGAKLDVQAGVDEAQLQVQAEIGANLLRHIPRLDEVSQIVSRQRESGALPQLLDLTEPELRVAIGARVLCAVVDYHRVLLATGDPAAAVARLGEEQGRYDPRVIVALESTNTKLERKASARKPAELKPGELRSGMVVDEDIKTLDNSLLLAKGHVISDVAVARLRAYAKSGLIKPRVRVLIDAEDAENRAA